MPTQTKPSGKRLNTRYARTSRPGPKGLYPWNKWMTPGSRWLLRKGKDYSCEDASIKVLIRREAKKRGLRVSIYTDPKGFALIHRGKV